MTQIQPPDEASAVPSPSVAGELVRLIDAAHAALEGWPSAFASGDVETIRRTMPSIAALNAFLEDHGTEATRLIGSVVLELWAGADSYAAAGRSFVDGDVGAARANWDGGNAAWAKAGTTTS
jgi:hypothetical protein